LQRIQPYRDHPVSKPEGGEVQQPFVTSTHGNGTWVSVETKTIAAIRRTTTISAIHQVITTGLPSVVRIELPIVARSISFDTIPFDHVASEVVRFQCNPYFGGEEFNVVGPEMLEETGAEVGGLAVVHRVTR
jgi:hypothetical protein